MNTIDARVPWLDRPEMRHLIDGAWVCGESGERLVAVNPSDETTLAELDVAGPADVNRAVLAARGALDGPWGRASGGDRARLMRRLGELISRDAVELHLLDSLDMGLPAGPAPGGAAGWCVELLDYFAGAIASIRGDTIATTRPGSPLVYTLPQPIGVVGIIIPWNGPLATAVAKLCPVLATGCTAVLKPAEDASLSCLKLGALIQEAGFPDGTVNVITGPGAITGAALVSHPGLDKICFTGSTQTGRAVAHAAADAVTPLSLELGGKSPNIVFADADLDLAVAGAGMAAYLNSGQVCCAGTRLYVQDTIFDDFTAALAGFSESLRVGDSRDADTQIGPIASARQLESVARHVEHALGRGARSLAGGSRLPRPGYFFPPTLLVDVDDEDPVVREEIFGPVLCAQPFHSRDEVLRRANDTEYGLAAGVWTGSVETARHMAEHLDAGVVWVNTYNNHDPAVPFGGRKASGWGRDFGLESIGEYLSTKAVWLAGGQ